MDVKDKVKKLALDAEKIVLDKLRAKQSFVIDKNLDGGLRLFWSKSLPQKGVIAMKRLYPLLILLLALIFLTACESGGEFRIINETSFPVYATVGDGDEVIIPAKSERGFEIETEKQHFFNPNVSVPVPVKVVGETYQIYDEDNQCYRDSTTTKVKAGKVTKAFLKPNRASFKIVNQSSQAIEKVELMRHNFVGVTAAYNLGSVAPGSFKHLPVDHASSNNNFYYFAVLEMEDGSILTYGDPENILEVDTQFLITITDPE